MSEGVYRSIAVIVDRVGLSPFSFVGCTKEEVDYLESRFECNLPAAYRAFLEIMGRSAGGSLFDDLLIEYQYIEENNGLAEDIIRDSDYSVPENRFIFASRLRQIFVFFGLSEESNGPQVYRFHSDKGIIKAGSHSFTTMLENRASIGIQFLGDEKLRK